MHSIVAADQPRIYGKIGTRSDPGVLVAPGVRHQGVSLMRPDDTAPDGAVLIPLRRRDGTVVAHAIVDAADAEWVNQWRWHLSEKGYATRGSGIRLHRALLGLVTGDEIEGDHIDRNRLDCRRSNLRSLPKGKNQQNRSPREGLTSRHRGVSWSKAASKWMAKVKVGGRTVHLGVFASEEEAAAAARDGRSRLLPFAID